eukprot:4185496-Heterocapsa_arctica.AAC.1
MFATSACGTTTSRSSTWADISQPRGCTKTCASATSRFHLNTPTLVAKCSWKSCGLFRSP